MTNERRLQLLEWYKNAPKDDKPLEAWPSVREIGDLLESSMNWKKVEDEKPKDDKYVLTAEYSFSMGMYFYEIGYYDSGNFYDSHGLLLHVNYWIEITEPGK